MFNIQESRDKYIHNDFHLDALNYSSVQLSIILIISLLIHSLVENIIPLSFSHLSISIIYALF